MMRIGLPGSVHGSLVLSRTNRRVVSCLIPATVAASNYRDKVMDCPNWRTPLILKRTNVPQGASATDGTTPDRAATFRRERLGFLSAVRNFALAPASKPISRGDFDPKGYR